MPITSEPIVGSLEEKVRSLQEVQRAALNILDDFDAEKNKLQEVQTAALNLLEDFDAEKRRLEGVQSATLNILEDFDAEKSRLEEGQRATLNILEDFNAEKERLEGSQRALLNILEDIDVEKAKVAGANQQLEAANQELDRFFSLSLDMLCIAGFDGYFKRLNPAWEKTLGFTTEELLAQPYLDFVHPDDRPATVAEAQKISTGAAVISFENRYRSKDGSYKWLLWKATPLPEQQLIYAAARDITERKQSEEELHEVNRELERRTQELEALNRELEAFTYSVSHDLRAPLRHVDGFAKILQEEVGPRLDATGRHYLQRISDGTRQMGQLVDDLLNLARVARQELRRQVTGLNSLVEEVLADLKPEMQGRKFDLQVARLPFVECDPSLMKQVFANLLGNAVKFTRPREHAIVEVGQMNLNGQQVLFVHDNGVGFSMKYTDKLFGVFQRLHRQEDFEGTGVGLATVERIIHKHGGRIWAEAELNRGATFYFTLGILPSTTPEDDVTLRGAA